MPDQGISCGDAKAIIQAKNSIHSRNKAAVVITRVLIKLSTVINQLDGLRDYKRGPLTYLQSVVIPMKEGCDSR